VTGGNVIKDQFIRPSRLVSLGLLDGVAGVYMVKELDPLNHASAVAIEAGDNPFGQHR